MTGCAPLQTVRLVGVAALAPEVNAAKNLVRLQPGSDAFKAALATLQQINGCAPALATAVCSLGGQRVRGWDKPQSSNLQQSARTQVAVRLPRCLGNAVESTLPVLDTRCTHATAAAF